MPRQSARGRRASSYRSAGSRPADFVMLSKVSGFSRLCYGRFHYTPRRFHYNPISTGSRMPATARSNTLSVAARILGGTDALAETLGVSKLQVERWLGGQELVPTDIFLRAVDLLEQHDRRKDPRASGNDTQPGQG
jgi:hypothetical protein